MVTRVKSYVFRDESIVILFCPRISNCPYFCSTFKKYARQSYDIVRLNPSFCKEDDVDKVLLEEELKRRNELKNRLGFLVFLSPHEFELLLEILYGLC